MGTLKAVIGFLVIIGCVYAGFQIVPPELSNYSFQDDLHSVAMMGGSNPRTTDQQLIDSVILKAKDHQITLAPESVTVQRIGTPGAPAVYGGGLHSSGHFAGIFFHSAFHSVEREQGLLER